MMIASYKCLLVLICMWCVLTVNAEESDSESQLRQCNEDLQSHAEQRTRRIKLLEDILSEEKRNHTSSYDDDDQRTFFLQNQVKELDQLFKQSESELQILQLENDIAKLKESSLNEQNGTELTSILITGLENSLSDLKKRTQPAKRLTHLEKLDAFLKQPGKEYWFNDMKYLIGTKEGTITENRLYCKLHAMTLAIIRNKSQNDFLSQYNENFSRLGALWNPTKQSWEWEDGSELEYTNWYDSELRPCREDCCTVEMINNGKWRMFTGCKTTKAFSLCQKVTNNHYITLNHTTKEEPNLTKINRTVTVTDR